MTTRDDLAVAALAKALVRTGMYVDAGIDTSAGLDKPNVYAAAILNDPDLAADGLHFVMIETLDRAALAAPAPEVDVERLARAIEVVSEGRPEYIVTGAEHAIYWTNEMVAKHIAAEYARLRENTEAYDKADHAAREGVPESDLP